jgi:hypothetical protein
LKQLEQAVKTLQKPFHDGLKKQTTSNEWSTMRLLSYIDLQQWAQETGSTIPPGVLAREFGILEKRIIDLERLMGKVLESGFLLQMGVKTLRES